MATNITSLTREWIQYLKNKQIVKGQSDPKTGRLNYKRKPTVQELIKFLDVKTDFDEDDIKKAIKAVLSKKQGSSPETPALPGKAPEGNLAPQPNAPQPNNEPASQTKKYSNDDAEDAEFRDVEDNPGQPRALQHKKPRYKYRSPGKMDRLAEAFYDRQGSELDEDDIKNIFRILLTPKEEPEEPSTEPSPEDAIKLKQDYMRKLKQMAREVMNPQQRKALWRALGEETLAESIITKADVAAIFKDAAYLRSKPSGFGRIFKGLRKDKIDVEDLRQAWADGLEGDGTDGYSDDTQDIKRILLKFGYSEKEIDKVFADVFSGGEEEYNSSGSEAVQKVADLAKKHGIAKQLRAFLEQEFPDDIGIDKKATFENVKYIFDAIVQEERTARSDLIRQQEHTQLGRHRK